MVLPLRCETKDGFVFKLLMEVYLCYTKFFLKQMPELPTARLSVSWVGLYPSHLCCAHFSPVTPGGGLGPVLGSRLTKSLPKANSPLFQVISLQQARVGEFTLQKLAHSVNNSFPSHPHPIRTSY